MKVKRKISLKWRIFAALTGILALILVLLWLCQTVFLNSFYKTVKVYEAKNAAQDIASIANADMVVFVGGESDEWIEKALEATPKAGRVQVNLMEVNKAA